jgi:hypothetical protein
MTPTDAIITMNVGRARLIASAGVGIGRFGIGNAADHSAPCTAPHRTAPHRTAPQGREKMGGRGGVEERQ